MKLIEVDDGNAHPRRLTKAVVADYVFGADAFLLGDIPRGAYCHAGKISVPTDIPIASSYTLP